MAEAAEQVGTVNTATATSLLLLTDATELKQLQREGWFKSVGADRWRTIDIVQGRIKSLIAMTTLYSVAQLANVLAFSAERIRQLTREGVLKQVSRGRYNRDDATRAYVIWQREQYKLANQSTSEVRVRDARAREIETRTQQRLNRLVPLELYEEMLDNVCGLVRSEFAGLPAAFSRDLTHRRALEREVNARLRRIAEHAMAEAIRLETNRSPADAGRDHGAGPLGGGEPDVSTNGGGARPA